LEDGVTLLSGSVGCSIRAWDTDSGECIEVIGDKEEEGGHADSVLCLCVLPDGNSVVSGSVDNTVKIWSR
jgi:WD40 repeat protein